MVKAPERGTGEGNGSGRKKLTRGKNKIPIRRIEKLDALQVCFSKRRHGVFKKASELSARCGAEVALVVFSPAGKPYSLGHPSVNAVVDRFLGAAAAAASTPTEAAAAALQAIASEFIRQEEILEKAIKVEERRRAELGQAIAMAASVGAEGDWTRADLQSKGLEDLEPMLAALERVQAEASARTVELLAEEAMKQCAPGTGAGGLFPYYGYHGSGAFATDASFNYHVPSAMFTNAGGSHNNATLYSNKMLMDGASAGHVLAPPAPPLAPTTPLPPPPPPPFSHGFAYNNDVHLADPGFGNGHVYGMEGFYGTAPAGNFFGPQQ